MSKTDKFCVEWRLSRQNRFINMWHRTLQDKAPKYLFCALMCQFRIIFLIFRGSKGSLSQVESNADYQIKIGWQFPDIIRGTEATLHKLSL